jgi:ergothioneine biosynthesis protein EgtC
MCRFIAYIGNPITLDELILKPENSLIRQSYHAREMAEPLNGDGFGIGWYDKQIRETPALFRWITPAWSNQNLLHNAPMLRTSCLVAHIRAATEGFVSELNTHPFLFRQYLFMHNGGIRSFKKIKRALINRLPEDIYLWIKGQTDSEHICALLMANIRTHANEDLATVDQLADAFQETFNQLEEIKREHGIDEVSNYNMVLTDGIRMVATRYSSAPEKEIRTLYYAMGERFECEEGVCRIVREKIGGKTILIVSEKLTDIEEDWQEVPQNHIMMVDWKRNVFVRELS